jgi:hypothetical protein
MSIQTYDHSPWNDDDHKIRLDDITTLINTQSSHIVGGDDALVEAIDDESVNDSSTDYNTDLSDQFSDDENGLVETITISPTADITVTVADTTTAPIPSPTTATDNKTIDVKVGGASDKGHFFKVLSKYVPICAENHLDV